MLILKNWFFLLISSLSALREKCPDTEFYLVCIFPLSEWIWRDLRTAYLSVFSLNVGKCGPEKTSYLGTFHAVQMTANMIMRISTVVADFPFYLSHPEEGINSKNELKSLFYFNYGWIAFIFLSFCFFLSWYYTSAIYCHFMKHIQYQFQGERIGRV